MGHQPFQRIRQIGLVIGGEAKFRPVPQHPGERLDGQICLCGVFVRGARAGGALPGTGVGVRALLEPID